MQRIKPSDHIGVVATIDPDATAASTVVSDWVAAKDFADFMAVVKTGTLGTAATVDAVLRQATDATGTGAKDVAGKSITQLTQAGTDESDRQAVINLNPDELDVDGGFTHFALSLTVAAATSDVAAIILGVGPRLAKPEDVDLASVVEIVA